ncbi:MAG: hypothetical protein GX587_11755 [Bacteroidales bacterium]|nr:hypothetical protein [Bacteroidales bacterium]
MALTEFKKTIQGILVTDYYSDKQRFLTNCELDNIRSLIPDFLKEEGETRCFFRPGKMPESIFSFSKPNYQSSFYLW